MVCTFTNTKHASLTVVKVTDPASDPQDFDFDLTGSGLPSDLDLDTDAGNATLASQQTFNLNASQLGTKSLTESAQAGWDLTDLECTGDGDFSRTGATADVEIDAGESVVCTFTNTKHASLTVVKVTDPASDPQDFDFDLTGSGLPSDLDLDTDAGNATLASQQTFNLNASQLGTKTVTESLAAGWALTDLECMGGGGDTSIAVRTATLDIDAGETVVCTFENTKDATVTVVKDAIPDDAQDFAFTTSGLGAGFSLDDDGDGTLSDEETITVSGDEFGAKSVTETATDGWTLTGLACTGDTGWQRDGATANLDVDPGETIVCTFENTKDAEITIVKDATPADGTDFDYTGGLGEFKLDDGGTADAVDTSETFAVPAADQGSIAVTENVESGWTLDDITCSDDAGLQKDLAGAGGTATLDVDPGDEITCTFFNKQDAKVTIVKDADPADGTDFDYTGSFGAFKLDEGGAADATTTSTSFTIPGDEVGERSVAETEKAGWTLADITCSEDAAKDLAGKGGSVTLDVDEGDDITCTFVNKKDAKVTVIKDADPADGTDFDYTGSFGAFKLDDGGGRRRDPDPDVVRHRRRPGRRQDGGRVREGRLDADRHRLLRGRHGGPLRHRRLGGARRRSG